MGVNPLGLNSFLPHGFSFKFESDSTVNEPVENGFQGNGIFYDLLPVFERNLACDDCAPRRESLFKNVIEILHDRCWKFLDSKVIEDQAFGFYEPVAQAQIASFSSCDLKLFNEFVDTNEDCIVTPTAGLVSKRCGEIGFSDTRWALNQNIPRFLEEV